ncbi:MFS general substrate transporter [Lojkania enalia]|uniref:MFS general substrate transporter n=1 Tax=Lojkania enalia TaxID=147567 RepID=A0A9P4MUP7_9PLEO|nr:MFS general substrate transporter [Didymosphaeria enalia]
MDHPKTTESGARATHHENVDLPLGYEDPHQAALEDNPDHIEKITASVILSALFLVTPILVQLSERLGGEDISFWIPSGWGAAAAVGFSVAGRVSDIFGRRVVILFGQFLTIVGGIIAATANSMDQLIAGEVVLGVSIGIVSVAYAGISEIVPNKFRGIALAWTEFNLATWATPGTLLATTLLDDASWRVSFYLCIGYGAFSFIGTFLVYFPPSHPRPDGKTKWQEFKELDSIGAFMFISGLAVFLYGLNSGGNTYPWSSASTLMPLILGVSVFLGRLVIDPLFPWYLFKIFREFSMLIVLVFMAGMVFFAAAALNAQAILYLHTPDSVKIGIYSLPSGASQFLGSVLIPVLVHYIKHVHFQLIFANLMQTLFFGFAALITPNNLGWLMACQFLAMLPFGWITLLCYTTASLNVPQRDLGVEIGLIGTFRSVGGAVGSVILSSIFTQVADKEVPQRIIRTATNNFIASEDIPILVQAVKLTIVGVPTAQSMVNLPAQVWGFYVEATRLGYAHGFRITWIASIPFGVVATLCAVCVRDPSKYFTNHVEVHLEESFKRKDIDAESKENVE